MTDADATAPKLKRVDQVLFDAVARDAQQQPRLRLNHNLHQSTDLVQRFLTVLHPGTYVRPHRHVRDVQGTDSNAFSCFREPSVCCCSTRKAN